MCASRPTGRPRHPPKCGGGRWVQGGRRFPSAATCSTRRSSAAKKRSCRATGCPRGNRCGVIATPCAFMSRTAAPARAPRPPSTAIAFTRMAPPVSSMRSMPPAASCCGRTMSPRTRAGRSHLGFCELAADRRRPGRGRGVGHARRVRQDHRRSSLEGPVVRRQLQLAASRDARRCRSDRVAGRTGRDQRRACRRQGPLDS